MNYKNIILAFVLIFIFGCKNFIKNENDENIFLTDKENISNIINNKNENEEIINGLEIKNIKTYETDSFKILNYNYNEKSKNLILINDRVFKVKNITERSGIQPYSGKIRVKSDVYVKGVDGQDSLAKNLTIALFNVENGNFVGNQLYLINYFNGSRTIYIRTRIEPNLDMVEGIDYNQVLSSESYDFAYNNYDGSKQYYKVKFKNIKDLKSDLYWINGQKILSCELVFNCYKYAHGNFSSMWRIPKELTVKKGKVDISLGNGIKVYSGIFKENGELSFGESYDEKGNKISIEEFKNRFPIFSTTKFNLKDEEYKMFRSYLGIL